MKRCVDGVVQLWRSNQEQNSADLRSKGLFKRANTRTSNVWNLSSNNHWWQQNIKVLHQTDRMMSTLVTWKAQLFRNSQQTLIIKWCKIKHGAHGPIWCKVHKLKVSSDGKRQNGDETPIRFRFNKTHKTFLHWSDHALLLSNQAWAL